MILNFKFYQRGHFLKSFIPIFKKNLFSRNEQQQELTPSLQNFPALYQGENESRQCISCYLCVHACPTQAITLESEERTSDANSLRFGPAPKSFEVDENDCFSCGQCLMICPTQSLELIVRDEKSDPSLAHDQVN